MSVESAIFPYPEHWQLTTLGQLCVDRGGCIQTGPFGSQLHASDYVEEGIPSIMPKNISVEGVSDEDIARINEDDALRLSKHLVSEGDIIYSRRGDVEKCALISGTENGWLCGTGCIKVNLGSNSPASSEYIHAYLSSPVIREWISRHAVGATMPNLNTTILSEVPVLIPPKNEENYIASIWKNTIAKIVLNRQTNQTLEHIAQALFKSWFVDFEPTRTKIAAKQSGLDPEQAAMAAISGKAVVELEQLDAEQLAQLKTTAALFPNAFVESEFGEVPEGWETVRFKNIVEKYIDNRGKTPPTLDAGVPLLEVKHLPDRAIKPNLNTAKYVSDDIYDSWFRAHLEFEDIIISTVGSIGRICLTPKNERVAIAQNLLGLRFNRAKVSPYFMYYQMDGHRFRHDVDARLVVTVQASIKRKDLETIDLLAPSIELQTQFEKLVKPLVETQQSDQVEKLAELRDTLLPKLLSGELSPTKPEVA